MTQDILVKESKPDFSEIARREAEIESMEATKFQIGMIAAALVAAVGLSFLSSAGAVIAIGTALYIGGRVLKTLIANQIKDDDKKE
jgi:ABC-type sulfate transport system permease component